jgi:hypothetical protein
MGKQNLSKKAASETPPTPITEFELDHVTGGDDGKHHLVDKYGYQRTHWVDPWTGTSMVNYDR